MDLNFELETIREEKGYVRFKHFDDLYTALRYGANKGITFYHRFYVPWGTDDLSQILTEMEEHLNDDCIRQVIDHLTWASLIYLSFFNSHYYSLVEEKFRSTFKIFNLTSSTFGTEIGILNLRQFFNLFGKSLTHFSFCLDSIKDFAFGLKLYDCFEKYAVIYTIVNLTGNNLKTLHLKSLKFTDQEKELTAGLLQILRDRNVEVSIF